MLAICGGKGGCGKTTTAVGLAAGFAHTGRSPLVVDADREMPDVHVVADVPCAPGLPAVATGRPPDSIAHSAPGYRGVDVVPASGVGQGRLRTALDRVRQWSGPVVVDCPAGVARDAAVPLRVADRSLLVTTRSREGLIDTAKTAAMARELDAPPVGAVVVDRTPNEHSPSDFRSIDAVTSLLDCPVLQRIPHAPEPVLADDDVRRCHRRLAEKLQKRNI